MFILKLKSLLSSKRLLAKCNYYIKLQYIYIVLTIYIIYIYCELQYIYNLGGLPSSSLPGSVSQALLGWTDVRTDVRTVQPSRYTPGCCDMQTHPGGLFWVQRTRNESCVCTVQYSTQKGYCLYGMWCTHTTDYSCM